MGPLASCVPRRWHATAHRSPLTTRVPAPRARRAVCDPCSSPTHVSDSDGSCQHWHVTSGKCLHTIHDDDNQLYCVDYRNDGAVFATAGKDKTVRIYDEATKSLAHSMSGG